MYFLLLAPILDPVGEYRIFIDIKDTQGGPKIKKLHEVLCNNMYDFKREVIKDVKQIRSHESEVLQIADLFNGALSYIHRGLYNLPGSNKGKNVVIEYLREKGLDLLKSTIRSEEVQYLYMGSKGCR